MSALRLALVTGCTGLLGRALCALLQRRGCRVLGIARHAADGPWQDMLTLDLAEHAPPAKRLEGIDTVFHLAANTHAQDGADGDETAYRRVNVDGTRRLLEAAGRAGVPRVLFASSVKAMGEGGATRIDERQTPTPITAYGRSKLVAEQAVLDFGSVAGRHCTVLRFPLLYGPGAKGNLARLMESIDRRRFPPLRQTANRRSMLHFEDAAAALHAAAEHPAAAGRVFLVTDGIDYSTRDITDMMRKALGRPAQRFGLPWCLLAVLAHTGDAAARLLRRPMPFGTAALSRLRDSASYDSGLIRTTLGFSTRHTLADALPDMVASYRARQQARCS